MDFRINEQKFTKAFESKKGFQHNRGNLIKLFPLATDKIYLAESVPDMETFHGITGEVFRACHNMRFEHTPNTEELLHAISKEVATNDKHQLNAVIKALLFDEADELYLFSAQILPHLKLRSKNPKLFALQDFVVNLLVDSEVRELIKAAKGDSHENILYNLIIEQLNKLSTATEIASDDEGYYQGKLAFDIRNLFKEDLRYLSQLQEFYVNNVSQLIKYYYFHYVTQQSLRVTDIFDRVQNNHPLYFTLNWEKVSRSRLALEHGWKKLESNSTALFAHANTLELLNTIDFNKKFTALQGPFTYREIADAVQQMTTDEENNFTAAVNKLITTYRIKIQDFVWEPFEERYEIAQGKLYEKHHSLSLIHRLFSMVKYQFENSGRIAAYHDYATWFKTFIKSGFFKLRGTLGGSLKIDRELLLLMTELSIMSLNQNKILVTALWEQLERRGIYFDERTKQAVIAFFGKINTLEKKSDSGDAQYVKRLYGNLNGK